MARRSLKVFSPALNRSANVTFEDMNAQVVSQTFVSETDKSINAIGNSLRNSNVVGFFVPQGNSLQILLYEITAPSHLTYMFGLHSVSASGAAVAFTLGMGQNVYGRLFLVPVAD